MRTIRLAAAVALALSGCLWRPALGQVQLTMGTASEANPVLPSKEYDAIADAIGLDDVQRQVANAGFDDAQERMFAAKRRMDAIRARHGSDPKDEQAIAEVEQGRRALSQAILAEVDSLFQAVAAVTRADQRDALERERLAAKRRAIRSMLGSAASDGPVQFDVERAIAKAKLSPEQASAALAQLGPYRQRIGQLMQRLLDQSIVQQRKSAKASAADRKAEGAASGAEDFMAGMRRWAEAQAASRELMTQLAAAHRDALAALEQVLPADQLAAVRESTLSRVWPRTAMDPMSPERVIRQVLERSKDAELRTAVEAVRDGWRPRWWSATVRMAAAEDDLRGTVPFMEPGAADESVTKARARLREMREERSAADRDAWKALAAADPGRREFYEKMAARQGAKGGLLMMEGAQLPPDESAGGAVAVGGIAVAGDATAVTEAVAADVVVGAATMIIAQSSEDGEGEEDMMVFTSGEEMAGGVMLAVGGDGVPIVFGDQFGDGLGSNLDFSSIAFADGTDELGGGVRCRVPLRIDTDRAASIARTLGIDPASPAITAMLADYDAKANAARDAIGTTGRPANGAERLRFDDDAAAASRIDAYLAALASADEELIAGIAALGATDEVLLSAVRAERAAERMRAVRHADPWSFTMSDESVRDVRVGDCVRGAGLPESQAAQAMSAWAAAVGAAESAAAAWLSTERRALPELAASERAMMVEPAEGEPQQGQTVIALDPESEKRRGELLQEAVDASKAITAAAIAMRDAVLAVLPEDGKERFRSAWLRAAAPKVYADTRDAMPTLDAALSVAGVSEAQKSQVNALRGEHAARHRELCDRLAVAVIASKPGGAAILGTSVSGDANAQVADGRFERAELNARSLRRLRSVLTPEQRAALPALSRATTPPAPVRASP
jgi:hypothetical protein